MKQQIIDFLKNQDFTQETDGLLINDDLQIIVWKSENKKLCFVKCENPQFEEGEVWSFWASSYKDFLTKYKILTQ